RHVLLLCAQGGRPDAELVASIAGALQRVSVAHVRASTASLLQRDGQYMGLLEPEIEVLESFETFRKASPAGELEGEVARLVREYPSVNWWQIAAGERSFIDASFLVGGLGQRTETATYVESLIVNMARYFEAIFSKRNFVAAMCPEADSLFTYVFYQVARRFGVRIMAFSPNSWIREDGRPGFFLSRDEFLHSERMESAYKELESRALQVTEAERVRRFKSAVVDFDVKKEYKKVTNKSFVVSAITPHLRDILGYLRENAARDKDVQYFKIDVSAKIKANILRGWRRWRTRKLIGSALSPVPARSVFYGMQYQPEQTTLIGGNLFANQVATVENIAKCLPFGYRLIVKEHPRGRGARPAWQYRHLAHYPNIEFCDADSKEILKRSDAVVTITGTIGLEAMALDKPVIVLGNVYYDFADIVYKPRSWLELAEILRRVLVNGEYGKNDRRHDLIDKFFLSYLMARIPAQLSIEYAPTIAEAVCAEIGVDVRSLLVAV